MFFVVVYRANGALILVIVVTVCDFWGVDGVGL